MCWGVWKVRVDVGKCWGRCGEILKRCKKVCWGVRGMGKCWGRCVKVCWGVEEVRRGVGECMGCGRR